MKNEIRLKEKSKKTMITLMSLLICGVTLATWKLNNRASIRMATNENIKGDTKTLKIEKKQTNSANYTEVESTDGIKVPVPTGYRASDVPAERSVNGGFVIYEGLEEVPTDSAGLMQAQINRNQWVWVPISEAEASNMYSISGNTILAKSYKFGESVTTYTKEPYLDDSRNDDYDFDRTNLTQYLNGKKKDVFKAEMTQDFCDMLQSVKTYGGFYISRYEISDLNKNIPSTKRLHDNLNNQTWYKAYEKCAELKGNNDAVKTSVIWGIQFDETLNWIINTGAKTYDEVARNSSSWGNYSGSFFDYYNDATGSTTKRKGYTDGIIRSGAADYTKANNIYDLAGNVLEWTMEQRSYI